MAFGSVTSLLVLCLTGVVLSYPGKTNGPPVWPSTYMVSGELKLPYAEIVEPFIGYYDAKNKKSRVDYYDLQQTYQRADQGQFGASYKIAPITTYTVTNKMSCFLVKGIEETPVGLQATLPNLTNFQIVVKTLEIMFTVKAFSKIYPACQTDDNGIKPGSDLNNADKRAARPSRAESHGQEVVRGSMCDVWQLVDIEGGKKNVYTMWVDSTDQSPVRYEMMGFDSLIGSHYDKYILDYGVYNTDAIPASTFEPPANMTCGDFPGPGTSEHHILQNPMKEYIHNHDEHVQEMFVSFKNTHKKVYSGEKEHAQRQHNFRQNVRYIHSKNRAGLTFTLGVNHLADKSGEELKLMNGYRHTPGDHGALVFDPSNIDMVSLPDSIDWRLYGAVTPVKDQGVCGSCWSFGTAETIEGAYFMKTGKLVRLSQQQLIDCSWGEGNNGCDGGEDFRSYKWIMKNGGLTSEEQYGQYLAIDGECHSKDVKPVAVLTSYVNITSGDQNALRAALATRGPISVAIDASHKSLSFYANGVYYEPKCGNTPDDLDHAVLAVGYGTMNGQAYWLVKNSWSTYWGNDGYVLMAQKDNNCGVATAATFVNL